MIGNKKIGRLLEIDVVLRFIAKHQMRSIVCNRSDQHSLVLFRYPFFVEFNDYLRENYLDISLSDVADKLLIEGNVALGCSIDLGLQNLEILRARDFNNHPLNGIFLSHGVRKMRNLHSNLEAIDALLPLVEEKGLASMRDGVFDRRFDFSNATRPLNPDLRKFYLACMQD